MTVNLPSNDRLYDERIGGAKLMKASQIAVVLGVGSGLGAAIAHRFAQEHFAVALMARNTDKLAAIENEINASGARALSIAVDATDPDSVKA
ncbi:MAG TPA: SDR family NAD(P)-dependent oxidoreductase, partial [Allocoleopsis sp.]